MTRTIVAALAALVVLVLVAKIAGTGSSHPAVETVYTPAQVHAGLGHNPRAWVGHTVLIRGLVATTVGATTVGASAPPSAPSIAVLIDVPRLPRGLSALELRILLFDYYGLTARPTATLLLRPAPPNPLLAALRRVPIVNRLLPASERVDDGEVGVYRVEILPARRSCPQRVLGYGSLCYDGVLLGAASPAAP